MAIVGGEVGRIEGGVIPFLGRMHNSFFYEMSSKQVDYIFGICSGLC